MNARAEAPVLTAAPDWSELNQRWLVVEIARLRERIEPRLRESNEPRLRTQDTVGAATDSAPARPTRWAGESGSPPALERIAQIFALSPFERDLLLLAAGVEIDRGLRALLPSGLSYSLALALLDAPHWDALSPLAPLRHWQLVELAGGERAPHAALTIDERVLHAITGVAAFDPRLLGIARWAGEPRSAQPRLAAAVAAALANPDEVPMLLLAPRSANLPSLAVRRDSAVAGVRRAGSAALLVAAAEMPHDPVETEELARRLDREAALSGATLVFAGEVGDGQRRLLGLIDRLRGAVVLACELDRAKARDALQRPLAVIDAHAHDDTSPLPSARLRPVLQQFRVDASVLDDALGEVAGEGIADDAPQWPTAVWDRLRESARGGLDALALRIDSQASFDELVLPDAQLDQLRAIAEQLAHRHTVHEDWGFARQGARGLGTAALFTGESGTGKTLAAEAIANHARLDLYRIDLASTVSKYIGETERNLARLFDAAEASGAVLLFDEADALFGKRSEVKDSHDRYANIEIAYLLQRIESYRGLAILTTNLKGSLDKSFLRRIRFVVQFPFPDEAMRERLWRLQLPAAAPCREIDFHALARAPLSGGHIRSAALQAAFAAAAATRPIDYALLVQAVRGEFAKLERPWTG